VGDATGSDRTLQDLGNVILGVNFREVLRPVFARKDNVAHTTSGCRLFDYPVLGKDFLLDKISKPRIIALK